MQRSVRSKSGLAAPLSLPAGFAALLVLGAAAALAGGQLPAAGVLTGAAVIVAAACAVAELAAAPLLALAGWLTAVGFSGPPYGQLRPAGPLSIPAIGIIGGTALAGVLLHLVMRSVLAGSRLGSMNRPAAARRPRTRGLPAAISTRRLLAGALLLAGPAAADPGPHRGPLPPGPGRRPAALPRRGRRHRGRRRVLAGRGSRRRASLLLNWYFTPPLHTLHDRPSRGTCWPCCCSSPSRSPSAAWCTWPPAARCRPRAAPRRPPRCSRWRRPCSAARTPPPRCSTT